MYNLYTYVHIYMCVGVCVCAGVGVCVAIYMYQRRLSKGVRGEKPFHPCLSSGPSIGPLSYKIYNFEHCKNVLL